MYLKITTLSFVLAMSVSCKKSSTSKTKSIVGLESGQDAEVRNSSSPIYVGLSNWFQTFKATAGISSGTQSGSMRNIDVRSMQSKLPPEYMDLVVDYLNQQIGIIEAFQKAITGNNRQEISKLLNQETLEMKDIALVILSPDTQIWTPVTNDKLALTLYQAKLKHNASFIDRFATQNYLGTILKSKRADNIPALIEDAEAERNIYLQSLKAKHLGDLTKFSVFLDTTKRATLEMRNAISGNSFGLGGTSSESGEGAQLSGDGAALMAFLGYGARPVQSQQNISQNSNQASSSSSGPFSIPSSWSSLIEGTGGSPSQGSNFFGLSQQENQEKIHAEILRTFVDPKNINSLSLADSSSPSLPTFSPPSYDCNKNLDGYSLVFCHRTAGYANLKSPEKRAQSTQGGNFSLGDTNSNKNGVITAVKPGSAESGAGHIFHQGSVGSCSLQAAVGAAYISLVKLGINDPSSILPKDGDAINEAFGSIQGSQPFIAGTGQDAITTVTTLLESKGFGLDSTSVDGWDGAINCISSGKPVLIGVEIDMSSWTAFGGGSEFGGGSMLALTNTNQKSDFNLAGSSVVTCGNSGAGHAIVGVATDANGDIVIKNSWGSDWQAEGMTKMSKSSCGPSFYGYCINVFKK